MNELERLVLRLPLIKLVISFQIINLILSIIQAIINAFFKLPFYIPICVFSFELIVFFLIFIIKKQNVKHIENIDEKIKNSTYNIKELRIKSSSLLSFCKDDSSKENILIIIDKLKFSDPVSNDATTNVEKDIFNKLSLIENNLKNGVSVSSVDEVIELIEKRNIICKGNK